MKTRILLLISLALLFSARSQAQVSSNCSYGSYSLIHSNYQSTPCTPYNTPTGITRTDTYAIWCTNENNDVIYFNSTSSVTGTGQNYCSLLENPRCPPVMSFQETDALVFNDYNRFYNRAYNYTASSNGNCIQSTFSQDFQQCIGKSCGTCHSGCGGGCTPILIDTTGNGWDSLTNIVSFDLSSNGIPEEIGWSAAGSGLAFLVLPDPDTGLVTDGRYMFGPRTGNGFNELAALDKNLDGVLDGNDPDFWKLMLWRNDAGDGICKLSEMHTLASLGVTSLSLKYSTDRRTVDGNVLRYRALVNPDGNPSGDKVGRIYYDVILKFAAPTNVPTIAPSLASPATSGTSCWLVMPWNGGRC